jgi:toxin YoeB
LRSIELHPRALADLSHWIAEDRRIAARVMALLDHCARDPFQGIGKPEPLKRQLQGFWSRRITGEHRLVYRVSDERIFVLQCRNHYE